MQDFLLQPLRIDAHRFIRLRRAFGFDARFQYLFNKLIHMGASRNSLLRDEAHGAAQRTTRHIKLIGEE
jgi:hypothetical protein